MSLTEREQKEIDRANVLGRKPVVFVHGLWLHSTSWDRWRKHFENAGYSTLSPGWPDDPDTVDEARAKPEVLAGKTVKQVTDHYQAVIDRLKTKPAVVGHSLGGLITQQLASRGLSAASVAIDPAPFRGVLPLPFSALRAAGPILVNPANRGRAVALTYGQFRYAFANAVSESEARALYNEFAIPTPGLPLFQAAFANLNSRTEATVDTKAVKRGPLLVISGEKDHTVPRAIAEAAFKRQRQNPAPTDFKEIPGRGHSLTIDSGWQDVADVALAFVKEYMKVELRSTRSPILAGPPRART